MPSSQMPGYCNPAMWSYGMMQWQQPPGQAQQYPYQMHAVPYPVMMPRMSGAPWYPVDNYTSLPPKAKPETEDMRHLSAVKPTRRFSDPGPDVGCIPSENVENEELPSMNNKESVDEDDVLEPAEAQMFLEEARKDKLFACLLQELRAARNLNRHFCLELHKTKLQLHLIQQQPPANDHPPGSVAAMVRKMYDAHHLRSEVLSNWNKSEDSTYGRRSSCYSNSNKHYEVEDPESVLMKEREILINRLTSTEKKIQYVRNSQWNGGGGGGGSDNGAFYHKIAPEVRPPMSRWDMLGELGLIQSAPTSPRRAELFIERDGYNYAGRFPETRSGTAASERGTRSTSTRTSTPGIPWNASSLGGSRSKIGATGLGFEEETGGADFTGHYEHSQWSPRFFTDRK